MTTKRKEKVTDKFSELNMRHRTAIGVDCELSPIYESKEEDGGTVFEVEVELNVDLEDGRTLHTRCHVELYEKD